MPFAIGGSSAAAKPHGPLWVDVRDYGARADGGVTDNSVPIQAAVDDLGARMRNNGGNKGTVFIPSAPLAYGVTKSIWLDSDHVEVMGEGTNSTVTMTGSGRHPVFIVGVNRVETVYTNGAWGPLQIDPTNRPDLFGKLDASAAPSPGVSWGVRTNGNSFVQFQAGPIACGVSSASSSSISDNWSETSKLTLEICAEPPDGQTFPTYAPLLGFGSPDEEIGPFVIRTQDTPNKFLVFFRTSDIETGLRSPNRSFSFSLGTATPPYRIAIQFDLDNAACSAFVNGVQVPTTDPVNLSPGSTPPFTPGAGLKFITNDHFPFMLGAVGATGPLGSMRTGVDLRVYGLRLSNTIRYKTNGPGQAQIRVDSPTTPINDAYAYFGRDARTICFLKGSDNPATSGRVVSVQHGGTAVPDGVSSGVFLHGVSPRAVAGTAIRNLSVGAAASYGQAISVGNISDLTLENVRAYGGYQGVGSFMMTANYNVYMDNVTLEGSDAGYFGAYQMSIARNVHIPTAGRVAIRHLGCSARWENVVVAYASPVTECIFKARGSVTGGTYVVTGLLVDFEGTTLSRAAIYCEAHSSCPTTSLELTDIQLGTIGATSSVVMLRDLVKESVDTRKCWVSVENLTLYTADYTAAVDVDGPLWYGEVNSISLEGPRLNHRQKWGTAANVLVREVKFVAPPRVLPWYAGAHLLEVRSPADGQYSEWRCVGSGRYGTSAPPTWAGLHPVSASKNALAGYVLNHAYFTAALS